jgi:tRNA(fMet)-specific endonuclease VapC
LYIIDTNTLIYFFKGIGNVSKHLFDIPPNDIGIPSIVLFELEVGIAKSKFPKKRFSQLKDFTSVVNVLSLGPDEARISASVRADLERRGMPIGPYDVLIAGTALSKKGTLVTHNIREFSRINGLSVVDWY